MGRRVSQNKGERGARSTYTTVIWHTNDLRTADHPGLIDALERGRVVPIFILDPIEESYPGLASGAAARWWLHHSLISLAGSYRKLGIELSVYRGDTLQVLYEVASKAKACALHFSRRFLPDLDERDSRIGGIFTSMGLDVRRFSTYLLHPPEALRTGSGSPYKVFTPFYRKFLEDVVPRSPINAPPSIERDPDRRENSQIIEDITALGLLPSVRWDLGFYDTWIPGTQGGLRRLEAFRSSGVNRYDDGRDRPDIACTSMLSPHLHFGEVSPSQVWYALRANPGDSSPPSGSEAFLREVAWREFSWHVLVHNPESLHRPLRPRYEAFPWRHDKAELRAWQRGLTGYPIVDAGMRQLWHTGWMHNRVRMIVASFLTKHLLHSWEDGAAWFWDTLVDADPGNNTMGWQWAAGCGADAQPYFRIFHPVTQGEKFDPDGTYVRRWVPELAAMPAEHIHQPWNAPEHVLQTAAVSLGVSYPRPIVDHKEARARALDALATLREETD